MRGALAGFEAEIDDKVLLAPLPSDLDALVAHPLAAEKLMPVLGLVRSPSVDHAIAAAEAITERGGLGHTSAVYATDDDVIEAFSKRVRTGRILVNAPTAWASEWQTPSSRPRCRSSPRWRSWTRASAPIRGCR